MQELPYLLPYQPSKIFLRVQDLKSMVLLDPLVALSKFKADVYDIVPLDIRMPGLNGLELYERFMQINNKVVVFFVTAYGIYNEALEQLFPNLSKDFFIMKPIDIAELIQRVTTGYVSLQ